MANIILLRHGEVEGPSRLLGKTDSPCTAEGKNAMHQACADLSFDKVISSPLIRCREFTQEFCAQRGMDFFVDERLQEVDFGDWDGMELKTLWSTYQKEAQQYFTHPFDVSPPNGEKTQDFVSRVCESFEAYVEDFLASEEQQNLLVVAHGGVIKTIIAQALNIQPEQCNWFSKISINYASTSSLSFWQMPVEANMTQACDSNQQSIYSMVNYTNR